MRKKRRAQHKTVATPPSYPSLDNDIKGSGNSAQHPTHLVNALHYELEGDECLEREECQTWDPIQRDSEGGQIGELPTKIYGSASFKDSIIELFTEFTAIFSRTLKAKPADLPALYFEVDKTKWHKTANMSPPRVQSLARSNEIARQVDQMLSINLIEESLDPYHSQVHLVPKPNGKWRFTIDFRMLYTATNTTINWPLPNIADMLRRLGQHRPRFFAKFDMTSGYHQAPLHPECRKYTTFTTTRGNYQWNRVPMGLTSAGAWFHYLITSLVLSGLVYVSCEGYLDDIIVHAQTEPQLIDRLKEVFQRFNKHGLTLNPDKCEFGLQQVEFVGHLIDFEGLRFLDSKLDGVRDFQIPQKRRH
jgi:hypothetical protein